MSIQDRPLRIAVVAVAAANNSQSWRGVMRSMTRALREAGADVVAIEIGDGFWGRVFRVKEFVVRCIIGRRYQRHRESLVLGGYGRMLDRALRRERVDVAISLKTIPISSTKTQIPLVLYNDSPFSGLLNFYAEFSGMSAGHVAHGHRMETNSAKRAALSIYTSKWAADLAQADYGVPADKVTVIPIGANLEREPTAAEIETYIERRLAAKTWQFLWLGVDWERKRGAMAIAIIDELRRRGYDVHLTVAGTGDRVALPESPNVTYVPFLHAREIETQLETTHFLIFPTLADCTPLVYSEANAFGVPVLSTDVGGVAGSIREGRNGHMFPVDAEISLWADCISRYIDGYNSYASFARTSFAVYQECLNWRVAAKDILKLARGLSKKSDV